MIAMAGLAEAAEYDAIMLWRIVVGLAVVLALWGLISRSLKFAGAALLIVSVAVLLVQPWSDFFPQPVSSDPDANYWLEAWRILSGILIVAFVFCATVFVLLVVRQTKAMRVVSARRQS